MHPAKLLQRIGRGDIGNVQFTDLVRLLKALDFEEIGGKEAIASLPALTWPSS